MSTSHTCKLRENRNLFRSWCCHREWWNEHPIWGRMGLQVAKRSWRSASVRTRMAFKSTPSTSQPTQSNTYCMLINIIWLFSLWWEGPNLGFLEVFFGIEMINKIQCKGTAWTKEKKVRIPAVSEVKVWVGWGWNGSSFFVQRRFRIMEMSAEGLGMFRCIFCHVFWQLATE